MLHDNIPDVVGINVVVQSFFSFLNQSIEPLLVIGKCRSYAET